MCAAQGIEHRAPLKTSVPLQNVMATLRTTIPALADDRFMAPDLSAAATLVAAGTLTTAALTPLPEL
jgi:histidine ammonia-lyase